MMICYKTEKKLHMSPTLPTNMKAMVLHMTITVGLRAAKEELFL
jgi:hypothetical protein